VPASQAAEQGLSKRGLPQLRLEQVREISRFLSRRPLESSRCLVVIEAVEAMAEGRPTPCSRPSKSQERGC